MGDSERFEGWAESWMEMRAQPQSWWGGIELYVRAQAPDGDGHYYIKDVIIERLDFNSPIQPPTLKLSKRNAQVLMDDLWASGIRPSEKRDIGGALRATENHLGDMQRIAFRLLEIGEAE